MTTKTQRYPGQQARRPTGSPGSTGGQFAEKMHAEPDLAIREISDEEYNADGSYAYPPRPRSAAQHIDFWTRVPLPEDRLKTLATRYPKIRQAIGDRAGLDAAEAYKDDHPDPTLRMAPGPMRDAAAVAWQQEVGRVFDAAAQEATKHMPPAVYRTSVRPILRAHQMYVYAGPLPKEEREAVYNHEMVVDGRVMTVKEIYEAYELKRLENELL